MNYLSTNLKHLRIKNNLKQEDIAKIVGKARSLVSAWESDDRGMTTEDIIKLSDYFNIPMDELVGKDLRFIADEEKSLAQHELLFSKNKEYLTESDWNIINAIIEQRKKEIDKELGED